MFCSYLTYSYAAPPQSQRVPEVKTPQLKSGEGVRESPSIPDEPSIREFSVDPTSVSPNNRITLSWRVEPRVSRITGVNVASPALGINVRSSDASGSYTYTIPTRVGTGRYPITLTATNEAGRSTVPRVIELNVVRELGIRIIRMWTNPEEFSDGESVEFHVGSNYNEGANLRDVMVFIFYGGREISRIGPFTIGTGGMISSYGRPVPTVAARPGTYTVEVRSGDQISRSEFRTESLTRYKFPR